ncbi:hypothetical protein V1477_018483, partial [Vespula maculifrons]
TQFQYIASTTDPGPTAWRLLHLGTHGLTSISVGLLFAPENTTSLPADTGVRVLPILPLHSSKISTKIELDFSILKGGNPHRSPHPRAQLIGPTRKKLEKDFGKILNNAAIRKVIIAAYKISTYHKYFRPKSHRVEVAASGLTWLYSLLLLLLSRKQSNGAIPLPTNSSLQTLKLQPHAYSHLGTDLRIAQLSNIESFDHHLSTTAQTPESKIESTAVTILTRAFQKHSREYVEYVGSNFGHNRA